MILSKNYFALPMLKLKSYLECNCVTNVSKVVLMNFNSGNDWKLDAMKHKNYIHLNVRF